MAKAQPGLSILGSGGYMFKALREIHNAYKT